MDEDASRLHLRIDFYAWEFFALATPSASGKAVTVVGASYSEFFIRVYSRPFVVALAVAIRGANSTQRRIQAIIVGARMWAE